MVIRVLGSHRLGATGGAANAGHLRQLTAVRERTLLSIYSYVTKYRYWLSAIGQGNSQFSVDTSMFDSVQTSHVGMGMLIPGVERYSLERHEHG
jgi:hypothetical protein